MPSYTALFFCLTTTICCCRGPTSPGTDRPAPPGRVEYEVYAIQYAGLKDVPINALVDGADPAGTVDTAFMLWMVRGHGRTILVDAGFYREQFVARWHPVDHVKPSLAIARLGIQPADVTDIIITHLHWDHVDGVDLFPNARVWIQEDELRHYAAEAHDKPSNAGVFAEDLRVLDDLGKRGRVTLIHGNDQTIFPGIVAYTGGKHTFQSQFVSVATPVGTVVLASDNVYLYENIDRHAPITGALDAASNLRAQDRMKQMVPDVKFIIPGHDARVMTRFPRAAPGVVKIQ